MVVAIMEVELTTIVAMHTLIYINGYSWILMGSSRINESESIGGTMGESDGIYFYFYLCVDQFLYIYIFNVYTMNENMIM